MTEKVMKMLLNVAKGHELPDAVIRNGKIINVFTNEIEEGLTVSMKNGWIASVERDTKSPVPDGVTEIDAEGLYLCPGFIDAHTHLDSLYRFSELPPYAIRGGTTTIVSESAMVGTACGYEGFCHLSRVRRAIPCAVIFLLRL